MIAALAALDRGDEAFWRGDRPVAVQAWREALAGAVACPEVECRAVEAMAHLRLVRREGNLAPLWHEGAWTRALSACPLTVPLCVLAEADRRLTVPAYAGGDVASVPELVAPLRSDAVLGPAADARHTLAVARGAVGAPVSPNASAPGMARGIATLGRAEPPDPGTWTLAIGVTAAPYAGVGGFVRFVDPDLAGGGHRLTLAAGADSWGQASAAIGLGLRVPASPTLSVAYQHTTAWHWVGGTPAGLRLDRLDSGATVAFARGAWTAWGGVSSIVAIPSARVAEPTAGIAQWLDPSVTAVGPQVGVRVSDSDRRASVTLAAKAPLELADGSPHPWISLDARARLPLGRVELAGRVLAEAAPGEAVWYLQPALGGTTLLRGLPYGRFRSEVLAAAQVESRLQVVGPLHLAGFVDAAWCDGPHASVGGGLRLVLPPERDNVTRVDVAWSPDGWGVVLGFGEAF